MNSYDDIINLPHHVSLKRKRMDISNRAMQFMPFSALSGYSDALKKKEEILCEKIVLGEDNINLINLKLIDLSNIIHTNPLVNVTYFVSYNGNLGKYFVICEKIKKIDNINKYIMFINNKKIFFDDIISIK